MYLASRNLILKVSIDFFLFLQIGGNVITITREKLSNQTILGFGGAFTDASGINVKSLGNATQYLLMK